MFFDDAILMHREFDLSWMTNQKKLHVGFPEKKLEEYLSQLVEKGYKCAIIEQTETNQEMEQ